MGRTDVSKCTQSCADAQNARKRLCKAKQNGPHGLNTVCEDDCVGNTDRLSGLDSSFLHMERDGAHMHVASTIIFEGPAPSHEDFRDHIASRLHLVPRFRQKLRAVPFGQGRPVWVDDPHLNLDYHVRQTALPSPGPTSSCETWPRGSSPSSSIAPSPSGSCGWSRAWPTAASR